MQIFNEATFKDTIQGDKLVLVDFFATWCMPCKMLSPILDSVAEKFEGKVIFGKIDIDKDENVAREYDIYSVPTLLLFKDGKKIDMSIGYKSAEELTQFLTRYTD